LESSLSTDGLQNSTNAFLKFEALSVTVPCSYVTITWAHRQISVQLPFAKKQEFDFDDFAQSKKFENHKSLAKTIAKSESKSLPVLGNQNQRRKSN
jgi:hypothetical protein